ncbi:MAG: energy transducer TonB [Geobacteraceae bacterium]|nr:energy transducer TonB [Geobacteraceae bacterium]
MNEQVRYFGLSAGVHAALCVLLVAATSGVVNRTHVETIDFSLNDSPPFCEQPQEKRSQPAVPNRPQAMPEPVRPAALETSQPAAMVTDKPAAIEPAPQPAPAAVQAAGRPVEAGIASGTTVSAVTGVRPQSVSSVSSNPTGESSVEQVRKKYLKEHFNYIRDLIVKRLAYPPIARRMEWSGKVILAFVVAEDGGVSSVRVKESSGYPLLDNSAVATVKDVAPFPRPPVAAEIIMPVHFRLQ